MTPLILEPFLRPQVWGGTRLSQDFGKWSASGVRIGESWEISGHPLHVSRVAEGPLAGMSLNDLWVRHRDEWCPDRNLTQSPRFPLLVKLLDCGTASSLQVHPTNEQAARLHPGESGKTEAWYVLEADPDSQLFTGLLPGVTEANLRCGLAAGAVVELLQAVTPQVGEAYLIPAGVPHAIGSGLVLFEIEQCSDITLRLFDWNRMDDQGKKRPLHVDEALRCLDWQQPPANRSEPRTMNSDIEGARVERLLQCEWFTMDRVDVSADGTTPVESLAIWFVISGSGHLFTADGRWSRTCQRGQTIITPPGSDRLRWVPHPQSLLNLLRCSWGA